VVERPQDGAEKGALVLSQLFIGQHGRGVVQLSVHPLVVRRQVNKVGRAGHGGIQACLKHEVNASRRVDGVGAGCMAVWVEPMPWFLSVRLRRVVEERFS